MATERRELHYRGHVQGVGFRDTARSIARAYAVAGFVRNLPDGRVHLVVEGESADVVGYLGELAERMAGLIREISVDVLPPIGEFEQFDVRF